MFGKKWMKLAMVGAAAIAAGARISAADTITIKSGSVDPSHGVFNYTISLDGTTEIQSGDGFVIYDFGGLTGTPTLTETSGTGSLVISDFTVMTSGFGNNLANPVAVNTLATADASTHMQLPAMYSDPGAPADGLGSPMTFDNGATSNLSFVYTGPTTYFTNGGTETYTLTLDTSSTNMNGQVSVSEAVGEDNNPANNGSLSFSENLINVPLGSNSTVQIAAPTPQASLGGLALFGLVGVVSILRSRRLANA
jgi:hypothetical protein